MSKGRAGILRWVPARPFAHAGYPTPLRGPRSFCNKRVLALSTRVRGRG